MNPSLNKRTDEYGNQSLENRCRFSLEVIREMRANMPEDMPLLMRMDAIDEMLPKVTTVEETIQFINWAEEAGVEQLTFQEVTHEALQLYTRYRRITWHLVSIWIILLKLRRVLIFR